MENLVKQKLELLAPAQNLSVAKCAILSGADAIYIGANSFGARKQAGNSLDDIKELVVFAHKYNVKIYVTVNTILNDNELLIVQKLIQNLYEIGVDAIIIQDMGILELDLPPIEIHASTQCNIRTKEKVEFFEKIGIKRAILARELSVKQIEEIRKNTNIELETFIHGALCVSYSGNCYMSASIGSRSANRGDCAQACRKKYSLINDKGKVLVKDKYLLSLKDFCAEKYLDDLIKAGVKSFKIEGRLKDENYVKNVVLYYRNLLDKYEKTSNGEIISDFTPDINKTFNRGYTTYFLGKEDKIFNFDTPKSMGEFIGTVSKVQDKFFEIKTDKKLKPQDGLCFFEKGELSGCLINKFENNKIYPNRKLNLKIGEKIYRNQDVEFENILKNSKIKRIIPVEIEVYNNKIKASFENNFAEIEYNYTDCAKTPEKMVENFVKCFKKSDSSIFSAKDVQFKTNQIPFLAISELNSLRRNLYEKLEEVVLSNYKRNEFKKTTYAQYKEEVDYKLNIHNFKALEFYKKCGINPTEFSLEKTGDFKNKELMRTKYCIRKALNLCLKDGNKKEELFLVDELNKKYKIMFDCKKCENIIVYI